MLYGFRVFSWARVGLLAITLGFVGCDRERGNDGPSVVVSIYPLYLIARDIGGPELPLTLLLTGESDPHAHSLKVSDLQVLRDAELVLLVDQQFEHFFHKPLAQNVEGRTVLYFSDVSPATQSVIDRHLWLDPVQALAAARVYKAHFSELFPARTQEFVDRLKGFERAVGASVQQYHSKFQNVTEVSYIVDHNAYSAFGERFGLASPFVLRQTDEDALSAQTWVEAQAYAKRASCLVVDHVSEHAHKLSKALELSLVAIDPLGLQPQAQSYLMLMDQVAAEFFRCFNTKR